MKTLFLIRIVAVLVLISAWQTSARTCSSTRCYYFYKDTGSGTSWTKAQQLCADKNMTLAIVMSQEDQDALINEHTDSGIAAWLGAKLMKNMGDWFWVADGPNDKRAYKGSAGLSARPPLKCGYVQHTDPDRWSLKEGDCDGTKRNVLCSNANMDFRTLGEQASTFHRARQLCLNQSETWDLAHPNIEAEDLSIRNIADKSPHWVGIHTPEWMWHEGTNDTHGVIAMEYSSWDVGKPTYGDTCLHATASQDKANWGSDACTSKKYRYICSKDLEQPTTPATTSTDPITTAEPTTAVGETQESNCDCDALAASLGIFVVLFFIAGIAAFCIWTKKCPCEVEHSDAEDQRKSNKSLPGPKPQPTKVDDVIREATDGSAESGNGDTKDKKTSKKKKVPTATLR